MSTSPRPVPASRPRAVLLAGLSAAVWVVFQVASLAASDAPNPWAWQGLVINVLPALLLAIFVVRGSKSAAVMLGVYGLLRFLMAVRVLAMIGRGTATQFHDGLALESALVLLFASIWIAGGVSVTRGFRARAHATSR